MVGVVLLDEVVFLKVVFSHEGRRILTPGAQAWPTSTVASHAGRRPRLLGGPSPRPLRTCRAASAASRRVGPVGSRPGRVCSARARAASERPAIASRRQRSSWASARSGPACRSVTIRCSSRSRRQRHWLRCRSDLVGPGIVGGASFCAIQIPLPAHGGRGCGTAVEPVPSIPGSRQPSWAGRSDPVRCLGAATGSLLQRNDRDEAGCVWGNGSGHVKPHQNYSRLRDGGGGVRGIQRSIIPVTNLRSLPAAARGGDVGADAARAALRSGADMAGVSVVAGVDAGTTAVAGSASPSLSTVTVEAEQTMTASRFRR